MSGGVIEVQPDSVTVLSDEAIYNKDLDEKRTLENKKKAEDMLSSGKLDKEQLKSSQQLLNETLAQLQLIKKLRSKKG